MLVSIAAIKLLNLSLNDVGLSQCVNVNIYTVILGFIKWRLVENFISEIEKLILPISTGSLIKYYVNNEQLFQILNETHIVSVKHGGRNRIEYELGRF